MSIIHQEAITQLILEIAVSPNVALCVEAGFCQIQSQIIFFVFLIAVPNMVPGVMVDVSSVSAAPQPPAQPTQFNLTLNWRAPFDNFDPILNYTIITTCSDASCPVTHVTRSNVTTLDISYNIPITAVNYTISITASNTVGTSDPTIRILACE